jgi:hypothetical protein
MSCRDPEGATLALALQVPVGISTAAGRDSSLTCACTTGASAAQGDIGGSCARHGDFAYSLMATVALLLVLGVMPYNCPEIT